MKMKNDQIMKRAKKIDIQLPDLSSHNKGDNEALFAILGQLENISKKDDQILESSIEESLLPQTSFTKISTNLPQISFVNDDKKTKSWKAGNLAFGFNLPKNVENNVSAESSNGNVLKDKIGDYIEVEINGETFYILTPKQLLKRFDGKLKELNHAGMNFGPKILEKQDYLEFKKLLSDKCNLYNYPTGEEWPFIIPSTETEFKADISDKSLSRNPKFELVYSEYHPKPLIQLDIETKLSKREVFELLPEPYGISFDGLENFFRTVFIYTSWSDVILRFDLRFKSDAQDFAYWMVKEGGRIK